jgi:hypothetical protein
VTHEKENDMEKKRAPQATGTLPDKPLSELGNYPLPRPDDDPRFTLGLAVELRDVLTKHGYPEMTGIDIVNLQQALYGFLYE